MLDILQLKFGSDGLIPCIVQDYYSKRVLTLAYMSAESLKISMEKGLACFYSRSRNELWLKGESSGNYQHIVSISADCDLDALVAEVIKDGPACHLGNESCFVDKLYSDINKKDFSMEILFRLIEGRKLEKKEGSYTSYLFEKGLDKILKKVGEECAEVLIAAKGGSREETIFEISDLIYHILVLMAEMDIPLNAILDELCSRHVIDRKIKQETLK